VREKQKENGKMGTRHLIAVQSGGEYKIAQYGQWDGYPEGQGVEVLSFLCNSDYVAKLKANLANVRFVDKEKDKDFIEAYDKNTPNWSNEPDNRTQEQVRWFDTYISRNIGSRILENIAQSADKEIIIRNSINFAADSLMCEYAYIVDFDADTFEIYRGFQKRPLAENERFANLEREKDSQYFQVALAKKYALSELPTKEQFLNDLTEEDEDEEARPALEEPPQDTAEQASTDMQQR
jgi:hypothetical protein